MSEPARRRHHRPHSAARSSVEYQLARGLLAALRALPLERAGALMAGTVERASAVAPALRRIALDNLRHAFPDRSDAWRAEVLRGSFRNLGRLAAEVAHFDELRGARLAEMVRFRDETSEQLWRERSAGGGAIVATGHFGNWELFAHAQGLLGRPIHLVHRPLRNPRVDDLVRRLRGHAGTGVIYKHAAARDILRRLAEGAIVAIPIDQHAPGAEGVPIPFFGRPARTTLGPARLAQIAQVPMQVAVLVREGDSHRHRVWLRPAHPPPAPGRDRARLVAAMTELCQELEEVVRAHPEQWLWMHRRWRVDRRAAAAGAAADEAVLAASGEGP